MLKTQKKTLYKSISQQLSLAEPLSMLHISDVPLEVTGDVTECYFRAERSDATQQIPMKLRVEAGLF